MCFALHSSLDKMANYSRKWEKEPKAPPKAMGTLLVAQGVLIHSGGQCFWPPSYALVIRTLYW